MNELQILFPEPVVILLQGRRVKVMPIQLRSFEQFGLAAGELVAACSDPSSGRILSYASKNKNLRAILRASTDLSAWRVWRLPASVAVELMVHVVRINSSFFDQALVNLAEVLVGRTPSSN